MVIKNNKHILFKFMGQASVSSIQLCLSLKFLNFLRSEI
jgi:hypothetical protein